MGSDRISLDVTKRQAKGKQVRNLRKIGIVPAVVYGADMTATDIQAPLIEMTKAIREVGTHAPLDLMLEGKKHTSIVKSIERDPVKNRVQHVAFQAVSKNEIVTTRVPITITDEDESEAKKAGLIILQAVEDLEVKAKPDDLPEALVVSAKDLKEHGDRLTVADIKVSADVELVDPEGDLNELTVASVYEPSALAAANERADQEGEAESTEEAAENVPSEQEEKSTEE